MPAAPQYYQPHLKETGVSLLLAIRLLKQGNPQNENIPRNFILKGEGSWHGARQRRNLFPRKRVHALLISGPAEVGIWDKEWLMIRRTTLLPGLYLNLILLSGCQRMNLRQSVIEPLQLSLIPISFTVTCLCSGQTGQVLCTHWLYILPGLGSLAQAHFPEKEPSLPQSGVGGPTWSLNHVHQSSVDKKQWEINHSNRFWSHYLLGQWPCLHHQTSPFLLL